MAILAMSISMRPHVLVIADSPKWAWGRKACEYVRWLISDFDIMVHFTTSKRSWPPFTSFDLIHTFEVSQLRYIPPTVTVPVLSGLTANVWRTWGSPWMRQQAVRCVALHGNSALLVSDLQHFHSRVYYTPNGVDTNFWRPASVDIAGRELVAAHVGKPNPRKGSSLIIEACRQADVKLYLCQRTSHIAYTPEQIRDLFYWSSHVQIACSDMDGTPNPCLEAAACSNVIISTPIGNMPEFIQHGVNGFLVSPGDTLPSTRPWVAVCDDCAEIHGQPSVCDHGISKDRREHIIHQIADYLTLLKSDVEGAREIGREARRTAEENWTWRRQVTYVRNMWNDILQSPTERSSA